MARRGRPTVEIAVEVGCNAVTVDTWRLRAAWPPSTGSATPRCERTGGPFGLKPWRANSFKVSPDPELVEKIRDLVEIYMRFPRISGHLTS